MLWNKVSWKKMCIFFFNYLALVDVMALCQTDGKSLSAPIMTQFIDAYVIMFTHACSQCEQQYSLGTIQPNVDGKNAVHQ